MIVAVLLNVFTAHCQLNKQRIFHCTRLILPFNCHVFGYLETESLCVLLSDSGETCTMQDQQQLLLWLLLSGLSGPTQSYISLTGKDLYAQYNCGREASQRGCCQYVVLKASAISNPLYTSTIKCQ